MKKIIILLFTISPVLSVAQLTVNNSMTVAQYVQNVLVGNGVTVSNIQYNGASANTIQEQVGSFSDPANNIGLKNGLILGSGDVQMAGQLNIGDGEDLGGGGFFNFGSDTDLQSITADQTYDECVVEFDFIPTGDTLTFNYVFSSEEYDEFVCGNVNDAFGFFLSGINPSGGTYNAYNIALVPDPLNPTNYTSTPVSINTINPGVEGDFGDAFVCDAIDPNWASYNVFYAPNTTNAYEYDGGTVVLQAKAAVVCNQTYHIKLAIADAGDNVYDSGVFIEAGSFSSNSIDINISAVSNFNTIVGDSAILEGCVDALFTFIRPDTLGSVTLDIDILGSATNGVDYTLIADSIYFASGQDSATITITTFADGIIEGTEELTINVYTITPCGDTVITSGTLYIIENYEFDVIASKDTLFNCAVDSVLLTAVASGGISGYTYQWSNGAVGSSIYVYPTQTTTYTVIASDSCNISSSSDSVIVSFNLANPLQINMSDTALCGNNFVLLNANTSGGASPLSYQWSTGSSSATALVSPSQTTTYSVTVTDNCGEIVQKPVTVTVPNSPLNADLSFDNPLCVGTNLTLTPSISGGFPPYLFSWSGAGVLTTNNQTGELSATAPQTGDYTLIVNDGCNQSKTVSTFVEVIGCTINIPNVITPNNDGQNDVFVIANLEYHANTEIQIYNRWGKIVYQSLNYKNDWKGTNMNNKKVAAGTYYYVLKLKDETQCDKIACNGFITVMD